MVANGFNVLVNVEVTVLTASGLVDGGLPLQLEDAALLLVPPSDELFDPGDADWGVPS